LSFDATQPEPYEDPPPPRSAPPGRRPYGLDARDSYIDPGPYSQPIPDPHDPVTPEPSGRTSSGLYGRRRRAEPDSTGERPAYRTGEQAMYGTAERGTRRGAYGDGPDTDEPDARRPSRANGRRRADPTEEEYGERTDSAPVRRGPFPPAGPRPPMARGS